MNEVFPVKFLRFSGNGKRVIYNTENSTVQE